MAEYIPKYLPIPIKHGEMIERNLAMMARTTEETAHWFKPSTRLTLPCSRCFGQGSYTRAPNKKRRPFDHRDFKPGDKYQATCPKCRGGGRQECTLKELRRAYRKIRKQVCLERGFEPEGFDRMVKKHVGAEPLPTAWYEAAKRVAVMYGIETTGL